MRRFVLAVSALLVVATAARADSDDLRKVRVFKAPPTDQRYQVLGSITATEDDFVEAVDALKEEAIKMEADAVIITGQEHKDRKLFRSSKVILMADVIKLMPPGKEAPTESKESPPSSPPSDKAVSPTAL